MIEPGTDLVTALRRHVAADGDRVALTWLTGLAEQADHLTYAGLDDGAAAVAAALVQIGEPGDRVLLIHPPGLAFVTAFIGCLYADRVPVPVYPTLDSKAGAAAVRRIAADCQASVALVGEASVAGSVARTLDLETAWPEPTDRHRPRTEGAPDAVALLQYTSGSTGDPKGVVVTRANLAANLTSIATAFEHDQDAVTLSWLPAYHDMGLIGNILHPLRIGSRAYLGSPMEFLRRPLEWLRSIDRYSVTTSGAPNFAYDMVIQAIDRNGLPDVDLSRWTRAYSGAEPVSPATLRRFADRLSGTGFRPGSFIPCYGLAEATLLVASVPGGGTTSRESLDQVEAVSCGVPRDCQLEIVDEAGDPVGQRRVGEILVRGRSVAAGYWNRPDLSREIFGGTIPGREGTWLRTGDLGFLAEGELHVTGRIKDVMIVRGRNHYPHDIERLAVETLPALRPTGVVAFADPRDEGVVIVAEARSGQEINAADRARLGAEVTGASGLGLTELVLVPPGRIPKTTSGKLRRAECRSRYLAGEYGPVAAPSDPPAQLVAATVADTVEAVLGTAAAEDEPLVSYGLDSLRAVRLAERLAADCGVDVPVRLLLEGCTVTDLAARDGRSVAPAAAHGRLSKAQESLLLLQQLAPESDAYNISYAWEIDEATDRAAFEAALRLTLLRRPELAVRFVDDVHGRRREPVPAPQMYQALALTPTPASSEGLGRRLADAASVPFDPFAGPLLRTHLWQVSGRHIYQIVVHHIVTDLWSMSLVLRDLGRAYDALSDGRAAELPEPLAYDAYVSDQEKYLASFEVAERDLWLRELLPARGESLQIRTDHPYGSRRGHRAGRARRTLTAREVRGLVNTDAVAMLTALWAVCLRRYGTPDPVVVGVPVTGRPYGRHTRIDGLCTNTVPVAVHADPDQPLSLLTRQTRRQLTEGMDAGLYPLARAVEVVRPGRVAGRAPLVETLVAVQENPLPEVPGLPEALAGEPAELSIGALRMRNVPVTRRSSRYDLDVVVTPRVEGGYLLTLDYNAELFEATTAESILATYAAMVVAAGAEPEGTVKDAMVLSEADRSLFDSAGVGASPSAAPPVQRLRTVAETSPRRSAVVDADGSLDFGQLVDRVDRVAATLSRVVADRQGGR